MINMYLLNNPDHYCSHKFGHLYWKTFVTMSSGSRDTDKPTSNKKNLQDKPSSDKWTSKEFDLQDKPPSDKLTTGEIDLQDKPSRVAVFKQGKKVIGLSPVMDYVWRPHELESLSLYDWISNCVREKKKKKIKKHEVEQNLTSPEASET
jgi:hypothetical protein